MLVRYCSSIHDNVAILIMLESSSHFLFLSLSYFRKSAMQTVQ